MQRELDKKTRTTYGQFWLSSQLVVRIAKIVRFFKYLAILTVVLCSIGCMLVKLHILVKFLLYKPCYHLDGE